MNEFFGILKAADSAAETGDVSVVYRKLRELPLANYCELSLIRPLDFPALNEFLPTMPTDSEQKQWVGDYGPSLLKRTASLLRLYEILSWKHTGRGLGGKKVLDYGCGWGRMLRAMTYLVEHDDLVGVDPMNDSIRICKESGLHSDVHLISARPLPFPSKHYGAFDVVTLFSVFTHTPDWLSCDILRQCFIATAPDGLVFCTIRFSDWLAVRCGVWPDELIDRVRAEYQEGGYSFVGLGGASSGLEASLYGDTIVSLSRFSETAERAGWTVVGYDRDPLEPFQYCVVLSKT